MIKRLSVGAGASMADAATTATLRMPYAVILIISKARSLLSFRRKRWLQGRCGDIPGGDHTIREGKLNGSRVRLKNFNKEHEYEPLFHLVPSDHKGK